MAITDSNVIHGKDQVFKIDGSGGSLIDISDWLASVTLPINYAEAIAAGGGDWEHWKLGQGSSDMSVTVTMSLDANLTGGYLTLMGVIGTLVSFESGPLGDTATYPKISGECLVKSMSAGISPDGVPQATFGLRASGTVTVGAWSA